MVFFMKNQIQVMNIKCGGCAHTITKALEKKWVHWVKIDISSGMVTYNEWPEKTEISPLLSSLGYPEIGTPEAESLIKKAQSYMSCAIGKIS